MAEELEHDRERLGVFKRSFRHAHICRRRRIETETGFGSRSEAIAAWAIEPYRRLEQKRVETNNHDMKLTPGKHVVVTGSDFDGGEGILVHLNTKKYYQLNETATGISERPEKRQNDE